MDDAQPRRHVLTGFPDAAIHFLRALEDNRQRIASDHDLSPVELRSLFRIAAAGGVTPKQLATDLSLTNGAITGLSNRLVASGMLHRVAHPNDRRSLYLELTAHGDDIMADIHHDFSDMVADATRGLDADDLDTATRSLLGVTAMIRAKLAADEDDLGESATA